MRVLGRAHRRCRASHATSSLTLSMRALTVIAGAADARAPEAPQIVKSPTTHNMKYQYLFGTCAFFEEITFQSPKNVPDIITTAPQITFHDQPSRAATSSGTLFRNLCSGTLCALSPQSPGCSKDTE